MTYAHANLLLRPERSRRRHDRGCCPDCDTSTLPQTALEAIRRYEHIGRIPYSERLEPQPSETAPRSEGGAMSYGISWG